MRLPITVIIVSYNSASVLPGCIDALWEHLAPDQLLVVDNASTDTSATVAHQHGAEVIVNSVNGGFGAGCNLGARSARNDLLLFVNPDVCIMSVDAVKLQELAMRRPLGLLAPRELLAEDGAHHDPSVRRIVPWPYRVAREALGPLLPREVSSRLRTSRDSPGRRSWLSGALLFSARTEFLDLGGFDERLFLYYEDQELSRRYAKRGLPLSVTDTVAGRHMGGGSSGAEEPLRPVPRAASAMSSIELVGITHGPRVARRAWALYQGLRRCTTVVVGLMAKGPLSARSARKQDELRSTQSAAATLLEGPAPHYPLVKVLARGSDRLPNRAHCATGGR
jgi:N-acetylglucosaminyl-diphospho-decaprenol L-rhamnosyltransferase